jgi:hypothetical protein
VTESRPTKPELTPAQLARRKQLRGWIPAGIFVVLIAVVAVITIQLTSNGLGKHVAVLPGVSHFTAKGIKNINATHTVRFDLRRLPLSTEAIQLAPDTSKTFGPYDPAYAELDILTPGGPTSLFVGSFTVSSRGGVLASITTDSPEPDFASMHSQLYSEANVGLSKAQLGAFMNAVPAPGKSGSVFSLTVGTGTALGAPTTVSVVCKGAAGCDIKSVTRVPRS